MYASLCVNICVSMCEVCVCTRMCVCVGVSKGQLQTHLRLENPVGISDKESKRRSLPPLKEQTRPLVRSSAHAEIKPAALALGDHQPCGYTK